MKAQDFVCSNCDALFPPKHVTNILNSAWKINKKTMKPELIADRRNVKCDCGHISLVPKINNPLEYLDLVEDIIPYHLLDSPWVEVYLTEGKIEATKQAWEFTRNY